MHAQRLVPVLATVLVLNALPAAAGSDGRFHRTADPLIGLDWLQIDGGPALSAITRTPDRVAAPFKPAGSDGAWLFASRDAAREARPTAHIRVPVPSAVWLLASSLVALLTLERRKIDKPRAQERTRQ